MRCGNCGVDMIPGAAFCPCCGKRVALSGLASNGEPRPAFLPGAGLQANVAGLLCYLAGFVTGIIFLAMEPYKHERFVRFHAFQAIYLSVVWLVVYFAVGILPGILWRLGSILHALVGLSFFGLSFFLMLRAYNNQEFKVPLIGELAGKQA